MTSYATAGSELKVNTTTTGSQYAPAITALADGGWIVTWASEVAGASVPFSDIYQQRYDMIGNAVGAETRVNTTTTNDQSRASVTTLADGGWVVTWESFGQDGDGWGIYQQRYDADGAKAGVETQVNTTTDDYQNAVSIAALTDGGWIVTWVSNLQDGSDRGIYMQRYDANGLAGYERPVNTTSVGDQYASSVTALADGGWLVSWQTDTTGGIYQQRYDIDGDKVGIEARVNINTSANKDRPSVSALADGGWVVSWDSFAQDGDYYGIYQQRYDRDGGRIGAEVQVNSTTAGGQTRSSVTALTDGGWLVVWQSGQDGETNDLYQQRYDASGHAVGSETLVNVTTAGWQENPSVTALADGGWTVSWTSTSEDLSITDVYQRHFANDVRGTDRADTLTGTGWDEYLIGLAGNDTLDGQAGADVMIGGYGNDTYVVDSAGDKVQEQAGQGTDLVYSTVTFSLAKLAAVENLTLTGNDAINATGNGLANILIGNNASNTLTGGAGNDTLNGGTGADIMLGGTGNDTYMVDNTGDTVTESDGGGTDQVKSSVSFTLSAFVEQLELLAGGGEIDGTGNGIANIITGNNAENVLSGGAGNDQLSGLAGDDTLDGGTGADTMIGGTGDDTYVVDNTGDIVTESNGGGADLVQSSVTFTLSTSVEKLTLTGTGNINGNGNNLSNTIIGNSGINTLTGGAGNDRLDGGAGADKMFGDIGNDIYVVDNTSDTVTEHSSDGGDDRVEASVSFKLSANVEKLILTGTGNIDGTGNSIANVLTGNSGANTLSGGAGDDTLSGGGGNDILDGGSGIDAMAGGGGDDTYVVDNIGDTVTETTRDIGVDLVNASVSYTLSANVENLTLTGTGNIAGTGNKADNAINGNAGKNTLSGGLGNDVLLGRGGADTFVFDAKLGSTNIDTLSDFSVTGDTIFLDNDIFTKAGAIGHLSADAFQIGATARDATDRILYDSATGKLFYDADGNKAGGFAAVQFAVLGKGLALTAADFDIIG